MEASALPNSVSGVPSSGKYCVCNKMISIEEIWKHNTKHFSDSEKKEENNISKQNERLAEISNQKI